MPRDALTRIQSPIAARASASRAATAGSSVTVVPGAAAAARALARTKPDDWILLKASRGMKLERVLDELRAGAAGGAASAAAPGKT